MTDQLKLSNQLCFRLYACSKELTRLYRPLLQPLNLTYPQYLVMLVLWESDEPIAIKNIGRRLLLDTGTLTPLLKRLEQQGYVTRTRSKADERVVSIQLTEDGLAIKKEASSIPSQMLNTNNLTKPELGQLALLLDKLMLEINP